MSALLVASAVALIGLPAVVRRLKHQPSPSERAKLEMTSLVVGIGSLVAALCLCSLPVLLDLAGLEPAGLGSRHFFPGGQAAGWLSLVVLGFLLVSGIRALVRHLKASRSIVRDLRLGTTAEVAGVRVHVIPVNDPLAIALPRDGGVIVLSQGVIDRLDRHQLEVVVRHEQAHIRHHHHVYLIVADVVDRFFGLAPFVRTSTNALRLAVEQWADDEAVVSTGDRQLISGAMRRIAGLPPGPSIAAFAHADLVAGRIRHLEDDRLPPTLTSRLLLYLVTALGFLGAVGSLIVWAG